MKKNIVFSFLLLLFFVHAQAQWNLGANNYSTGNLGIGMSVAPASNKFEVHSTNDVSLFFLRQDKNNGGSGDAVFFRDDRAYGGNNTGTTFKIESWRGLGYQGGS